MSEMIAKTKRAIQTLNNRITLLKARVLTITPLTTYWYDLKREIADWERIREIVEKTNEH